MPLNSNNKPHAFVTLNKRYYAHVFLQECVCTGSACSAAYILALVIHTLNHRPPPHGIKVTDTTPIKCGAKTNPLQPALASERGSRLTKTRREAY